MKNNEEEQGCFGFNPRVSKGDSQCIIFLSLFPSYKSLLSPPEASFKPELDPTNIQRLGIQTITQYDEDDKESERIVILTVPCFPRSLPTAGEKTPEKVYRSSTENIGEKSL